MRTSKYSILHMSRSMLCTRFYSYPCPDFTPLCHDFTHPCAMIASLQPISAAGTYIWPCHGCHRFGGNLAPCSSLWPTAHQLAAISSTINCTNGPLFLQQMIKTPPSQPPFVYKAITLTPCANSVFTEPIVLGFRKF